MPAVERPNPCYPVISLVTCSYQHGSYIEQTIRSVIDQGYPALEYIVIDGGSTDGTVEIIKRYEDALAYWVSEPDGGQSDALIKGFGRTTGEICGWLCSDDLLLPGSLHAVADFFLAHPEVQAAYGDALWIDSHGRYLRPKKEMSFNRFVLLHDHNYIPQPSMFWRRTLYWEVGGLDPRFDLAMDADLWERFSRRTAIARIPRYLSCMRFYPEQKTRSRRSDSRRESRALLERENKQWDVPFKGALCRAAARCARVLKKALAGGYTARVPSEHLAWLKQRAVINSGR